MVVDVSRNRMSVGEAYLDTMRSIDAIVYEAQMDIMVAEYNYLAENGQPLMLEDGSENTAGIFKKVQNAIMSLVETIRKFFADLKEKIKKKAQQVKDFAEAYKAYYKLGKELDKMYAEVLSESKEAKKAAKEASGDTSKIKQILNKFKEKCHKTTKEAKEKYVSCDVYDADGNIIRGAHTSAKVVES